MEMPFGKHKGEDITSVPADYLVWLEQQNIVKSLRDAINFEIERRRGLETSTGRNVLLMTKSQATAIRDYSNFLTTKILKFTFLGKTNTEINGYLHLWTDEFISKHEVVP